MIDGDDTATPVTTPHIAATDWPRADACADCGQPTQGTIRCDACLRAYQGTTYPLFAPVHG